MLICALQKTSQQMETVVMIPLISLGLRSRNLKKSSEAREICVDLPDSLSKETINLQQNSHRSYIICFDAPPIFDDHSDAYDHYDKRKIQGQSGCRFIL